MKLTSLLQLFDSPGKNATDLLQLSILLSCGNLLTSCNKFVNFIKLQLVVSLCIRSFDSQLFTGLLTTCNEKVNIYLLGCFSYSWNELEVIYWGLIEGNCDYGRNSKIPARWRCKVQKIASMATKGNYWKQCWIEIWKFNMFLKHTHDENLTKSKRMKSVVLEDICVCVRIFKWIKEKWNMTLGLYQWGYLGIAITRGWKCKLIVTKTCSCIVSYGNGSG